LSFVRIDFQTLECGNCDKRFYEKEIIIEPADNKYRRLAKGKLACFCPHCKIIVGYIEINEKRDIFVFR